MDTEIFEFKIVCVPLNNHPKNMLDFPTWGHLALVVIFNGVFLCVRANV